MFATLYDDIFWLCRKENSQRKVRGGAENRKR
jgi:hypothetical protein